LRDAGASAVPLLAVRPGATRRGAGRGSAVAGELPAVLALTCNAGCQPALEATGWQPVLRGSTWVRDARFAGLACPGAASRFFHVRTNGSALRAGLGGAGW